MGINGLHKGLSFCRKKSRLHEYAGQNLAVDCSSWLHKSVYSVSERYVESTEAHLVDASCVRTSAQYISARCKELVNSFGIAKVYLVLDGERCPMKVVTNQDREEKRRKNLEEARAFKRGGNTFKSTEKYKTCIKIRADFTVSVMETVAKTFASDRRVELVWSPYEADAQLAKLCIDRIAHAVVTEDSDVLVYSAACRVAFPILFKLDRGTGECDMMSLDWFLSPSASDPNKNSKKGGAGSTVETLVRGISLRELRNPGFGARMFVQACVLSGCDYAPNSLAGIGLVTAFKLIRDNGFRDHGERFKKVLSFLPSKNRDGIDINEYEAILAKSEAVFYHHPVLCSDGTVIPLSPFRLGNWKELEKPHMEHFPCIKRLGDIKSFIGNVSEPIMGSDVRDENIALGVGSSKASSRHSPPIKEIVVRCDVCPLASTKPKARHSVRNTAKSPKIENPYKKESVRKVRSPNRRNTMAKNRFASFALNPKPVDPGGPEKNSECGGTLQPTRDFRFAKRQFPSITGTASASNQTAVNSGVANESNSDGAFSIYQGGSASAFGRKEMEGNEVETTSPLFSAISAPESPSMTNRGSERSHPPRFDYGSPVCVVKRTQFNPEDVDEQEDEERERSLFPGMVDYGQELGGFIDLSGSIEDVEVAEFQGGVSGVDDKFDAHDESLPFDDKIHGTVDDPTRQISFRSDGPSPDAVDTTYFASAETDPENGFDDILPAISSSPVDDPEALADLSPHVNNDFDVPDCAVPGTSNDFSIPEQDMDSSRDSHGEHDFTPSPFFSSLRRITLDSLGRKSPTAGISHAVASTADHGEHSFVSRRSASPHNSTSSSSSSTSSLLYKAPFEPRKRAKPIVDAFHRQSAAARSPSPNEISSSAQRKRRRSGQLTLHTFYSVNPPSKKKKTGKEGLFARLDLESDEI